MQESKKYTALFCKLALSRNGRVIQIFGTVGVLLLVAMALKVPQSLSDVVPSNYLEYEFPCALGDNTLLMMMMLKAQH